MNRRFVPFLLLAALVPAEASAQRSPEPCTEAVPACTDWVAVGQGRSMVYRNFSLDTPNEAITHALVLAAFQLLDGHRRGFSRPSGS